MNPYNFIVRSKRRLVEKYKDDTPWKNLDRKERMELIERPACLPSSLVDDDIAAKQFHYLILRAELIILRSEKGLEAIKKRVIQLASALEELGNVPMVASQKEFILEIQTDEYW